MSQIVKFDQLMESVAAGSDDAIWQLAETYTPFIIGAVRYSLPRRLRSKLDSQDIAQSLWASLLLNGTDLTRLKTPAQLIAFLARATKNKVIDKNRHFQTQKHDIQREERLSSTSPNRGASSQRPQGTMPYSRDDTPSEFAILREQWNHVLASISERERDILWMRLGRHSYQSISVKLQIHERTARLAMENVIERLRK